MDRCDGGMDVPRREQTPLGGWPVKGPIGFHATFDFSAASRRTGAIAPGATAPYSDQRSSAKRPAGGEREVRFLPSLLCLAALCAAAHAQAESTPPPDTWLTALAGPLA